MLLGLNVVMPLLEVIHFLIKFAQLRDVFVCDFIAVVKIYEGDVYHMYCDIHSFFQGDVIMNFQSLIDCAHASINRRWIIDLDIRTDHLVFEFVGQHIRATFVDQMGAFGFVTRLVFAKNVAFVKR
jgi:hypothetical protein